MKDDTQRAEDGVENPMWSQATVVGIISGAIIILVMAGLGALAIAFLEWAFGPVPLSVL